MRKCLPILLSCFLLLCLCLPLFWQPCNVAQAETYTITAGDYVFKSSITFRQFSQNIRFTTNGIARTNTIMRITDGRVLQYYNSYSGYTKVCDVYTSGSVWVNDSYRYITVLADTTVSATFYDWFISNIVPPVSYVDIWYVFHTDYVGIYPHAYIYQGELGSTYKVTEPQFTTLVPSGYTFLGWFDTAGNQFDFDLTYTATETEPVQYDLYGKWQTPYDTLFEILILPYTAFFDGFGNGVDWLFNELFIDSNGNMSTYGQFIFYIAGATCVVYIIKTVLYILIRGGRKCKND